MPLSVLIPIAIKYGVPAEIYLLGHLIGFLHGRSHAFGKILKSSGPNPPIKNK